MKVLEIILGYLFLFLVGALVGWVIELFYRRFVSPAKKWINPGFLNGPYLPLYGFGVCIMYAISDIDIGWYFKLLLFAVLLTLIEYIAGIIFIKGMKIKLWDYSECFGNIQGIICPLYTFFWTVLGAAFLFLVYPWLGYAVTWVQTHHIFSFVIGLMYGVILVDMGISFNVAAKIRAAAKRAKEIIAYERLKAYVRQDARDKKARASFLFPMRSKATEFKYNLENFIAALKEKRHKNNDKDEKNTDEK